MTRERVVASWTRTGEVVRGGATGAKYRTIE